MKRWNHPKNKTMKYKNGRTAQLGDLILDLTTGKAGVTHSISEQTVGNCRLVGMTNLDPWVTLSECLHIDDIRSADVPDLTFVPPVDDDGTAPAPAVSKEAPPEVPAQTPVADENGAPVSEWK
jgi:hypothetical protein